MPLTIIQNDMTKMTVDVIVNAANTSLQMGGGVCGAIFKAAGADKLQAECDKLAPIKTGEAVITPGFACSVKSEILNTDRARKPPSRWPWRWNYPRMKPTTYLNAQGMRYRRAFSSM